MKPVVLDRGKSNIQVLNTVANALCILMLVVSFNAFAGLPPAVLAAMEEALEHHHLQMITDFELAVFKRAAVLAPVRAGSIASLAGQMAVAVAAADSARQRFITEVRSARSGHRDLRRAIDFAEQMTAAAASARTEELVARAQNDNVVPRLSADLQRNRQQLVQLTGELEAMASRFVAATHDYREQAQSEAKKPTEGHQEAERERSAFNAALTVHTDRFAIERSIHVKAVAEFNAWIHERKAQLSTAQSDIVAGHEQWKRAVAELAATRSDSQANAAVMEQRVESSRAQLREVEQSATELATRTRLEQTARSGVLESARESLESAHQASATNVQSMRADAQAALAVVDSRVRAQRDVQLLAIETIRIQLETRFGANYAALHAALRVWLENRDLTIADALAGLRAPDAVRALELMRDSRAKTVKREQFTNTLLGAAERLRLALLARERAAHAVDDQQDFRRVVTSGLRERFREWIPPLVRVREGVHEEFAALTAREPQLKQLWQAGRAGIALLEVEYTQLRGALGDSSAGALAHPRSQEVGDKLDALFEPFPELRQLLGMQWRPLLERLGEAPPSTSSPVVIGWTLRAIGHPHSGLAVQSVVALGVKLRLVQQALANLLASGLYEWASVVSARSQADAMVSQVPLTLADARLVFLSDRFRLLADGTLQQDATN